MDGKRYDTPEYAWELLKEAFSPVKDAAQAVAGLVSPGPNTLGAAGVAGLRSLLPGSGTYRQELDRYNQAAGPRDSVTDVYPMSGEDPWDFARRYNRSPQVERQTMQAATMAAPLAARKASYLYHVTPEANAQSIARQGLLPDAPKIAEGGPHGNTRAVFLADADTYPTYQSLYGDEGLSVFRVNKDAVPGLTPDTFSEGGAFMTPNAIPPAHLEQLVDGTWRPVAAPPLPDALTTLRRHFGGE